MRVEKFSVVILSDVMMTIRITEPRGQGGNAIFWGGGASFAQSLMGFEEKNFDQVPKIVQKITEGHGKNSINVNFNKYEKSKKEEIITAE
uniref:Uncharacterized protein n=1 Tax=Romanomermis culicivorax TaxID=13658 RepID=A0A915J8I9_ROMCU